MAIYDVTVHQKTPSIERDWTASVAAPSKSQARERAKEWSGTQRVKNVVRREEKETHKLPGKTGEKQLGAPSTTKPSPPPEPTTELPDLSVEEAKEARTRIQGGELPYKVAADYGFPATDVALATFSAEIGEEPTGRTEGKTAREVETEISKGEPPVIEEPSKPSISSEGEPNLQKQIEKYMEENPQASRDFAELAVKYQWGKLSKDKLQKFNQMAVGHQPTWKEYQAYKKALEQDLSALSQEEFVDYQRVLGGMGVSTEKQPTFGEWKRAQLLSVSAHPREWARTGTVPQEGEIPERLEPTGMGSWVQQQEAISLGLAKTTSEGKLEPTAPLGTYSEKDIKELREAGLQIPSYQYERAKDLQQAIELGLARRVKLREDERREYAKKHNIPLSEVPEETYKLTELPTAITEKEQSIIEGAGFEWKEGPGRQIYEARFPGSEALGMFVGSMTGLYRDTTGFIPGKQPGEEQLPFGFLEGYKTRDIFERRPIVGTIGASAGEFGSQLLPAAVAGYGVSGVVGFTEQAAYDIPAVGGLLESGAGAVSSAAAAHPIATTALATAPIVGIEAGSVYGKATGTSIPFLHPSGEDEPISEIIVGESGRVGALLGFGVGFAKGFPEGKGIYHKLKTKLKGGTIVGEESVPDYVIDAEAEDDFPALRGEGYSKGQIANMSDDEIKAAYKRMANKYASPELRMTKEGIPSWHGTPSADISVGEKYTVEELASRHAWIRNSTGQMIPTSQATDDMIRAAISRGDVYGGQFFASAPSIHFTRTGVTSEGLPRPGIPSLGKPKFVYSEFPGLEYTGLPKSGPRFAQMVSQYEGTGTLVMPGGQYLETEAVLSGGTEMVPVSGGPFALEVGGTTIPVGRYLPKVVAESAGISYTGEGAVSLESLASSYTATGKTLYLPMPPTRVSQPSELEIGPTTEISEGARLSIIESIESNISSVIGYSGSYVSPLGETTTRIYETPEPTRPTRPTKPTSISSIVGYSSSYVSPLGETTTETYKKPSYAPTSGVSSYISRLYEEYETPYEEVTELIVPKGEKKKKKPRKKEALAEVHRRRVFQIASLFKELSKKAKKKKKESRSGVFGGESLTESLKEEEKKPKKKKSEKRKPLTETLSEESILGGD